MSSTSFRPDFIDICPHCQTSLYVPGNYCTACGISITPPHSQPAIGGSPQHIAARGFGQMFGLHPGIAFLTFTVDAMLFGAEAGSLGTSFPISLAASIVLGFIAFAAQQKWYGDDEQNAAIKAGILAFLTCIPTPLPAMVYVPAGLLGLAHTLRRKA